MEALEALLAPLTNYERQRPVRPRFDLDTMRALLERPGRPTAAGPGRFRVQVGGSKGKGTTVAYLAHLGGTAGLRTGTFVSPHVRSIRERIQIDGAFPPEPQLLEVVEEILAAAWARDLNPSFFEVMALAADALFALHDVELGIYEVGLGGRLDATTALDVDASILTGVELEHTELLGDDVGSIAREKSYVIRPGRPCSTAAVGEAAEVFARRAFQVDAPLRSLGRDFGFRDLRREAGGWSGTLWREGGGWAGARFSLPGAAEVELQALALAADCLAGLCPEVPPLGDGMTRPLLPGRFQQLTSPAGGRVVLDGAHTEDSLRALATELADRFPGERPRILFATAPGKRWREGLSSLLPIADSFHVTGLSGTRCEDPETVRDWLRNHGVRAQCADPGTVLADTPAGGAPLVVTGSFYLVAEVLELLVD